jgi:signal transduction histidine kinase
VVPVVELERPGVAVALVAVEGERDFGPTLAQLGRSLTLVAAVSLGALALFATLFVRMASSAAGLERRLSRAQNLATMGQMTAALAHEIRNPLGIIRNAATRLGQLDADARAMADFVVDEVDRLHRTLNRYLEFARGSEEAPGRGDALAALRATLALLEGETRSRGVTVECSGVEAGEAPVRLETESLKQVFLNLMLNALEAMPQGGTLRVACSERRGRFEIVVADTGTGMSGEVLARAGTPFFTTKARGSGLGLVLSRRLLRSAGGDLRIQSGEGRGTACTTVLPRRGA